MSWPNTIALAVFIAICGFIAYAGDVLGRRMGKRRLSIFGLRPRYTAIITTSITGMLIATFTIMVMVTASSSVRDLVLRGWEIRREYRQARQLYEKATKELSEQRRIATSARKEASEATRQRDLLTAEIRKITSDLSRLRRDLAQNKAALLRARAQLHSAQAEVAAANEEIRLRKNKIDEQNKEIERLERYRANLQDWLREEMAPRYKALRAHPLVFSANQEIARRVIECAQPRADIRREIMALINEADKVARAEGAKAGRNGRAVKLLRVKIESDVPGEGQLVTESAIIDALVENIWNGTGSVVVLAVAVDNTVEGEQALIDLVPYHNSRIYRAGEEVADTVIDGRQTRGQIFGSLVVFLRTEVRASAVARKIIPRLDAEGQPSVGAVDDWDQVLDLVDRIKESNRPVRVRALARRDTWSADTLSLDLVLSETP